jgi:nickel-dependent lactate racemase
MDKRTLEFIQTNRHNPTAHSSMLISSPDNEDHLTDAQIESAFFKPCASVEETVGKLLQKHGRDASICVLPDGTQTIPYIAQ